MQYKTKNIYNEPTMTYEYGNDEKEFIFCVKGRPFPLPGVPVPPHADRHPARLRPGEVPGPQDDGPPMSQI